MRIVRLPQTFEDLVEVAAFYGRDDSTVADRFYDRYEEALMSLARMPTIGGVRESVEYGQIRLWFIRGFEKVLILYKVTNDEILVLRLIHSARDYTRFI